MRVNPGGQIAPNEVIGRDALIKTIWRSLEQQSIILSSERRIGKTSVIQKMKAEAPPDRLTIYRELEGIKTPLEFAENVFRDVEEYLSSAKKAGARMQSVLQLLGGVQVGNLLKLPEHVPQHHWKDLLAATLADLADQQAEKKVILFWDEVPYMLYDIARHTGPDAAMELLDLLRQLRHQHRNLRMVYTGSIGLHNVIASFKRAGYANDPTNNMKLIDVPPLSDQHSTDLARMLLRGERVPVKDMDDTARAIAAVCDHIAYYIHHVVDRMVDRNTTASPALAGELVQQVLTDPQDPWHMNYYRERIDTYYTAPDEKPFALTILDVLAASPRPLSFEEIFNRLASQLATDNRERAREILALLQRDHYIVLDAAGTYRFRFPLLQRSWRLRRGLAIEENES